MLKHRINRIWIGIWLLAVAFVLLATAFGLQFAESRPDGFLPQPEPMPPGRRWC